MRSLLTSSFTKGFAGAIVALILGLFVIHLWSDHVALHVIADFLNQHGAQIRGLSAVPAAPPVP
jgi:hypothetical protein